nr:polysaccharide deacetylase family sporulation protein PdaB [Bacilli bacterium]
MLRRFTSMGLVLSLLFTSLPSMAFAAQQEPPQAIYRVHTNDKVVALTFDISWGSHRADPILDLLKNKDVKNATFFLSGPWVMHHQETAKRIKALGFEIGSHGYKHSDFTDHNDAWIREQVQKAEHSLQETLQIKPQYIRTPNGDFDERVLKVLTTMHYRVIQWRTDSLDWMNPGVDRIISRVLTRVVPGDIVLLHASDSCQQTHLALPRIIDGLREKGYRFVTISQLLQGGTVNSSVE